MTSSTRFTILSAALLAAMFCFADRAKASTMEELRARFEQRFPKIREMKDAGKVGETTAGLLDVVKDKDRDEAGGLVTEENADRAELYKLIAESEKTTPQLVAERNAKRNFDKAKSGDWLKSASGEWKQKGK